MHTNTHVMKTETATFSLLGNADEPAIDPNGFYYIDFNKITRAEDIVAIMAAVNFSFVGNHPRMHLIAHLVDRANVQYPKDITPSPIVDAENEDGGDVL